MAIDVHGLLTQHVDNLFARAQLAWREGDFAEALSQLHHITSTIQSVAVLTQQLKVV